MCLQTVQSSKKYSPKILLRIPVLLRKIGIVRVKV
jgi:hypothetical protein